MSKSEKKSSKCSIIKVVLHNTIMTVLLRHFGEYQKFEEILRAALTLSWISLEDVKGTFDAYLTFS